MGSYKPATSGRPKPIASFPDYPFGFSKGNAGEELTLGAVTPSVAGVTWLRGVIPQKGDEPKLLRDVHVPLDEMLNGDCLNALTSRVALR